MTDPNNPYDPATGHSGPPAGAPPPPTGGYQQPPAPGQAYQQPGPTGAQTPPAQPPYGGYEPAQPYAGTASRAGRPGELMDRFIARLIDHVILFVANMVIVSFLVVSILLSGSMGGGFGFGSGGSYFSRVVGAVLGAAIYLAYFAYLESSRGQTIGKMVMKLETRGEGGGRPTLEEAVKRNIWVAFGVLSIVPIIGGVLSGLGQLAAMILIAVGISGDAVRRQGWHDKFAGTQVVKVG